MRSRLHSVVLVTVGLLVGCEEPEPAARAVAIYALEVAGGQPLPAPWWPGLQMEIVADTLYLREAGEGVQATIRRSTIASGEVERSRTPFTWTVAGDRLRLAYDCPDNALVSCIAPPHLTATMEGPALEVDTAISLPLPARYTAVLQTYWR